MFGRIFYQNDNHLEILLNIWTISIPLLKIIQQLIIVQVLALVDFQFHADIFLSMIGDFSIGSLIFFFKETESCLILLADSPSVKVWYEVYVDVCSASGWTLPTS